MEELPVGNCRRLSETELDRLRADDFEGLANFNLPHKALFLVADFHVPKSKQYELRHLPPGPSKVSLDFSQLSAQQVDLINGYKINLKAPLAGQKLLLTFFKKKEYCILGSLLQIYKRIGVKVPSLCMISEC